MRHRATNRTLRTLFGSEGSAGVLTFLTQSGEGYASEISRYMDANLFTVQKQLLKFETAGLLRSRRARHGRARIYAFNPKYSLLDEIKRLVEKALLLENASNASGSHAALPDEMRPFFWDVSFNDLSWNTDGEFIIRRVLTAGSWEAVTRLRMQLGDAGLRRWLIEHKGRGLSPRQLRFWALVLGLPRNQVNAWVQEARANPWHLR